MENTVSTDASLRGVTGTFAAAESLVWSNGSPSFYSIAMKMMKKKMLKWNEGN